MDEQATVPSAFQSTTFDRDVSIKVNEPVGSASISPSGRDVVLASREGLHIIDLDEPYAPPLHLPHHSPWEVADVQWSPFASRDYWICSTSNQKALVWNLQLSTSYGAPIEHTLHAHSRAITDMNFSAHHPDILATCAVDSFVHCWDLRQPAKPANSFADFYAGATQVKWNRQDSHIIASSHDKFLRIWDDRKGVTPLRSIEAHTTKIYGIDWNRTRASCLLTCSLDKTIKFWNYQAPTEEAERVIKTPFPVWRARHSPFGWGVLAMPQRGDYDLHLYDRRLSGAAKRVDSVEPVHSYEGHEAEVKEFLWRSRGDIESGIDNRDFQLISWGQDRCLNFHKVTAEQFEAVGHEKGSQVRSKWNITRQGAIYKSFREENAPSSTSESRFTQPQGLGALIAAAGMSKAMPFSRGATEGSFVPPAIGMHTRKRARPVMNPIKWMEGVTIGKQERTIFHPHLSSRSSIMMSDLDRATHHDTPESLGDEITYVGKKYRKVTFESVDVARRMATLSLNGPWGAEGKSAFLRLSLNFPDEYPLSAIPDMILDKNFSFVSDEVTEQLRVGVNEIAKHSCARSRGSLEAVVTYLLGERNLADSMSLFDPNKQELLDMDLDLGESSDEDDEALADFSGVRGQDGVPQNGAIAMNANVNVPLPKGCGAMWADDGRLVCFFPPKAEPKPLFSLDSLWKEQTSSRDLGVFEGFGRLRSGLPDSKRPTESSVHVDDDDAEDSWGSSSSSSSSSSSELSWLSRRLVPPLAWKAAPLRFQRSSQQSTGGVDSTSKTTVAKAKTIITLRDMTHHLPSKKELGREYAIYGSGPSVCEHNAVVAKKHGSDDLVAIWNLVKLILYDEVPLEILSQSYRKEPILVMARRAAVRIKRKDSGLNLNYDLPESVKDPKLKGHIKWGMHPLASTWLIPAIFAHFEKLADIQMLAMLSCVFSEPAARESTANALMRLEQHELPISMKAPAFSLDYFPTAEVAWSLFLSTPELRIAGVRGSFSYPLDQHHSSNKLDTYGSAGSSNGPWGDDHYYSEQSQPATPRSMGITPPTLSRTNTFRSSGTGSFSTSPEQHLKEHHLSNRKSFTNLAARMIPFTQLSSSPDSQNRARRELDSLSASAPKTVGWGAVDHYEVPSTQTLSRRTKSQRRASSAANSLYEAALGGDTDPDTDSEGEKSYPPTRASSVSSGNASVKVTLKNQNMFLTEAHASVPLLDKTLQAKCRAWRGSYAKLLLIWGLPMQMAEMLKFNGLKSYWREDNQFSGTTTPLDSSNVPPQRISLPRRSSSNSPRASVAFANGSPNKHALTEIYAGFRASSTRSVDVEKQSMQFTKNRPATPAREDAIPPPSCAICWEIIVGLHAECSACGWKAHKECLSALEDDGEDAGCGCGLKATLERYRLGDGRWGLVGAEKHGWE